MTDYPRSYSKAIRYSKQDHAAFLKAIRANPTESTTRAVYADYLEEHYPDAASRETLDFLRSHQGAAWAQQTEDGKVHAGRKWTMAEIRDAVTASGSEWFSPNSMHFFRSRVHGEPYHGPGGITFVTSEQYNNANRRYTVRYFAPRRPFVDSEGSFSPRISTFEFQGHPSLSAARAVARRIAAGQSVNRDNLQHMAGNFDG